MFKGDDKKAYQKTYMKEYMKKRRSKEVEGLIKEKLVVPASELTPTEKVVPKNNSEFRSLLDHYRNIPITTKIDGKL